MKVKFAPLLMLLILAVIVPHNVQACAPCNYPVRDSKAVSIATNIVKNGVQQIKKLIETNEQHESSYNKIGAAGKSAFSFMKDSMEGNFKGKEKYVKENATLSKWGVGKDSYKEADSIKSKTTKFIRRTEALDANDYKETVVDAKVLLGDATAGAFSEAIGVRSMAKQMLQSIEDFKSTIKESSTIRDDIANSNLLVLSNALYVQQMLDIYASYLDVVSSVSIREEALNWRGSEN